MEEFYYEEESPNHVFIKCLVILFLIGLLGGAFIYYKKTSTIRLKNITIEAGSTLSTDVNDYLKSSNKYSSKYKLYISKVDTNKVGKYTYKIKYNKHVKTGYIKVVDTTKPEVVIDDNIVISNEDEIDLNIFVLKCDDFSLPCNVSLKNKTDYNLIKKVGNYNLDIVVSDNAGNKVDKTVNLTVSDSKNIKSTIVNDLEYFSNSIEDNNLGKTLFVRLDNAINEDSKEYEKIIQDTSIIDFSKYAEDIYSTRIITAYNKYGYVIGLQIEVTFNDGTTKLLSDEVDD